MLRESSSWGAWALAIAFGVFVIFLLARFNRRKLGVFYKRWENAPRYVHSVLVGVQCALFAWLWANWSDDRYLYLSLAWGALSALSFAQALYFFVTRHKPIDTSRSAVRRRAMRGLLWSALPMLPLIWMITQRASGAVTTNWPWSVGIGLAVAGAIIFALNAYELLKREPKQRDN
jgi:cytochrome bd-type quinol oxidase subunit 2